MEVELTGEQRELQRAVRDLATDRAGSAQLRAVMAGGAGYDVDLWRLVATDMGLSAIAVADAHGGAGGSFVDAAVVLEEAGRALLPVPLLATMAAAAAAPDDDELGLAISSGAAAALAVGGPARVGNVIDGGLAEHLVVAAPDALYVVQADALTVTPRPAMDPLRQQADIEIDVARARRVGDEVASARAVDALRVALAVEAVGVARWCLAATVEHLKTRVQFGKPIGTFQALQHRAADLAVRLESAAATASYAAWSLTAAPEEASVLAPLALAVCGEAAYAIAADAIQLHGGIGFTWEHDAHLYFKRAATTKLLLGDTHVQRRLAADRAGVLPS